MSASGSEASSRGGAGDSFEPVRAVLMELLRGLDEAATGSPRGFYDRICRGVCELTGMRRCALLLYDEREKRVLPAGSHGIEEGIVGRLHGLLEETPLAEQALSEDRVIVSSQLAGAIPERHRDLPGVETLACVPVAAGSRWLGVMLCDCGGGDFELDAPRRDLIWGLGKTAALAASTRISIAEQERAKLLAERVAFAREVHDRVMQRLFGISLVLGSGEPLEPSEQRRAGEEISSALAELRAAIQPSPDPTTPPPSRSLGEEARRLRSHYPGIDFELDVDEVGPPAAGEALAQSVLAEALHNVAKHAAAASSVRVATARVRGAFELEVRNDGVGAAGAPGAGGGRMGLRLAALEALQCGGVLEFGPTPPDGWRTRLVLPLDEGESAGAPAPAGRGAGGG